MNIQFSKYNFNIRVENEQQMIFDIIRRKYVVLTPEEWVRQHLVHYLTDNLQFPKSLISVEKQLILNGLQKRTDILLFNRSAKPVLIVECKAPEIKLSQKVFDQVARYNLKLRVPYLLVTNGNQHVLCLIDHELESWKLLEEFPPIAQIVD